MWWVGSRTFDVYLGTRAVVVCSKGLRVFEQAVDGFDSAIMTLARWNSEQGTRLRLKLWLSGGLCRPFLIPAVTGIRGEGELISIAKMLATQGTGLAGPCKVWVDRGKPGKHLVGVALDESTLIRILGLFSKAGAPKGRIVSIRPLWSEALRIVARRRPIATAIALQDCDSITLVAGSAAGFDVATTTTPVFDQDSAKAAVTRILLSEGLAYGPGDLTQMRLMAVNGTGATPASTLHLGIFGPVP